MALKPCRECKKPVSTEAPSCPHCGVPTPVAASSSKKDPSTKEKLAGLAVLALIVVVALATCGDSEDEKHAKAAAAAADKAKCKTDLSCIGERLSISAGFKCPAEIERLAKHSMKWTDGTLEAKFSHYRWGKSDQSVVTLLGDRAQFQNGFGAYVNVAYQCDIDVVTETVLDVRVTEGRL